ncbi:MAG TPA: gas vesicle protein GvpJ [Intrasporangium sp.]|nr:gas vesicle protein GvpJ [Intrasporangium sp.]
MTVSATQSPNRYLERPAPSSLADVVEIILDKGLVIDIYVRVSLVGIELITIDARIVVASVDTYLRFAEACNRLDLKDDGTSGLPDLMGDITESGAKGKTSGALEGVKEKASEIFGSDDDNDEDEEEKRPPKRRPSSSSTRKRTSSSSSRTRKKAES